MKKHDPLDLENMQLKLGSRSGATSKKVYILLLSTLIVVAMGAWLTFLGWGVLEALRMLGKLFTSVV